MPLKGKRYDNYTSVTDALGTDVVLVLRNGALSQMSLDTLLAAAAGKEIKFYTSPDLDTASEVEVLVGKMRGITAFTFNTSDEPGVVTLAHFKFQVRPDVSDGTAPAAWTTCADLASLESITTSYTSSTRFHLRVVNTQSPVNAGIVLKYLN